MTTNTDLWTGEGGTIERAEHERRSSDLLSLLTALLERDRVPCMTLTQPWASLMGKKRIETRSWATAYRGPVALHAAKGWSRADEDLCDHEPFRSALVELGYSRQHEKQRNRWGLPLGEVVAVGMLDAVHPITGGYQLPAEPERSFGNYRAGRSAWHFSAISRLMTPIPARGALGLWTWQPPASFWQEVREAVDREHATWEGAE